MTVDIYKEAADRAQIYAPKPSVPPTVGGVWGAFIVVITISTFKVIAGIDGDGMTLATTATMAIGFALPFAWLKRAEIAYNKVSRSSTGLGQRMRDERLCVRLPLSGE